MRLKAKRRGSKKVSPMLGTPSLFNHLRQMGHHIAGICQLEFKLREAVGFFRFRHSQPEIINSGGCGVMASR
jgi:hypothetical protein